jgi:NTP pyrophosphatase (non-canonical NTP hydrolase)
MTDTTETRPATLDELAAAILQWGIDRDFPNGATAGGQVNKLFEEGGELSGAVTRNKVPMIVDGIGDCFVVLCMIALTTGVDLRECIAAAYDEIKDRKGTMIDGKFVREEN